ncbi:unnamed protein product [Calicophoron daubneyi]|uniref:SREBP regulating gene protein n=1 Tax=Calicophoron daubneyi TaxID=300641 RepID=A0AAV2TQ99_CALDB
MWRWKPLKMTVLIALMFCLWCLFVFRYRSHPQVLIRSISDDRLADLVASYEEKFDFNPSNNDTGICRYTKQSPSFVVDDRGSYCNRISLLPSGCCNLNNSDFRRFVCDTCNGELCCAVYEHCVSCCLDRSKNLRLWEQIRQTALLKIQRHLLAATNPFELCQAKCRTSSSSVLHENVYRDAEKHFCFGLGRDPQKSEKQQ